MHKLSQAYSKKTSCVQNKYGNQSFVRAKCNTTKGNAKSVISVNVVSDLKWHLINKILLQIIKTKHRTLT